MRAINLSSKLRPSAYRSVTEMVSTSSQKVIKPFCFAPFIFLTWRRLSCLRQKVNDGGKIRLIRGESVVFISRRLTGDAVASCHWQRSAIFSSGAPVHLRWIADVPKFAWIKIELEQFQPSHLKIKIKSSYWSVRRWCLHKILLSPTTAGLPARLNSVQLRR